MSVWLLVTAGLLGFITFESDVVRASVTWYVGSGPGNDTANIQDAIWNYANPGDTVFVHSGVYFEQILIDKTINLTGQDRNTTIIDGMGGMVVQVASTDWVNITGFTITNGSIGIWITYSSNCTFISNKVHDHSKTAPNTGQGFFFSGTPYSNNTIIGNIVYNNDGAGIHLGEFAGPDNIVFRNNRIINNTVYNNTSDGIFIDRGRNNFIMDNFVHHNGLGNINPRGGIRITSSLNHSITGNVVHDNKNGIMLTRLFTLQPPKNNTIAGNTVYNNDNDGIRLIDAQDNTFIENSIFDNNYNVYMGSYIDPNQCYGNDFINSGLSNATISNVYMKNSGDNNFINVTLTNATTNVYMHERSWRNNFINCSLSNATQDDFNMSDDSHAILLNTTFDKDRVYYGDTLSTLTVKWFMHVHVIYYNGTPASYAEIWINDNSGSGVPLLYGPADSQGWIRWFVVTEYIEQDMFGDHIGNRFYFTPHNVTATDGSLWGYAEPFMDISKVVLIILGAPTYLPPLPPPLYINMSLVGYDVILNWDPPSIPGIDHYSIYRSTSQTGFDFNTIWVNTSSDNESGEPGPIPLRTMWNDTNAALPGDPNYEEEYYYIIRAVNVVGEVSSTSRTVGKWTKTFQRGVSTFSIPLEPLETMNTTIDYYLKDMNARYIKWMNPVNHIWMKHGDGGLNDTQMEVGKGYEIAFDSPTNFTFIGMPVAMILYDNLSFGFDAALSIGNADSLTAMVDPASGDVDLSWDAAVGVDTYYLYNSSNRDGFWGILGIDYHLLATRPLGGESYTHAGAALAGTEQYYMIVPFNSGTGERGVSSYSLGVWTAGYLDQYDTFGIPLKQSSDQTAEWFCDNIPDTVGMNYYINGEQRWSWHSTRMPKGAYDPMLVMTEGYQISTTNATKFTFIGI